MMIIIIIILIIIIIIIIIIFLLLCLTKLEVTLRLTQRCHEGSSSPFDIYDILALLLFH